MRRFFAQEVRDALALAKDESLISGSNMISASHIVLGLAGLKEDACARLLAKHGFDAARVRKQVQVGDPVVTAGRLILSRQGEKLMKDSAFNAFLHSDRLVHPFNVLLAFLDDRYGEDGLLKHLRDIGLDQDSALFELHQSNQALQANYRSWLGKGLLSEVLRASGVRRVLAWT